MLSEKWGCGAVERADSDVGRGANGMAPYGKNDVPRPGAAAAPGPVPIVPRRQKIQCRRREAATLLVFHY